MTDKFELIHLRELEEEPIIGYANLLIDIFDYKNNWFNKIFVFPKVSKKLVELVEVITQTDSNKLEYDENGSIKKPGHIDYLTYAAMMELQSYVNSEWSGDHVDYMVHVISYACFSVNVSDHVNFDSESPEFKDFKESIYHKPVLEMIGLFNWIIKSINETNLKWQERFLSVEVTDLDYINAGGDRMQQFNVISSLKKACNDFNVPYKEAWQLPYVLIQTNSYGTATEAHIQDNMRQLKEARMKAEKKAKSS